LSTITYTDGPTIASADCEPLKAADDTADSDILSNELVNWGDGEGVGGNWGEGGGVGGNWGDEGGVGGNTSVDSGFDASVETIDLSTTSYSTSLTGSVEMTSEVDECALLLTRAAGEDDRVQRVLLELFQLMDEEEEEYSNCVGGGHPESMDTREEEDDLVMS